MRLNNKQSKRLISAALATIIILLISARPHAQELEFISETLTPHPPWVEYRNIALFDDYLFTNTGYTSIVFDVSDPTAPDSLGQMGFSNAGWDRIVGSTAYADTWGISGGWPGCYDVCPGPDTRWYETASVDLSDPLNPQSLGFDSIPGWHAFEFANEVYRLYWYDYDYDDTVFPGYLIGPHDSVAFQSPPKQAELTGATANILTDEFLYSVQVNPDGTLQKLDSLSLPGSAMSFVRVGSYAYIMGSVYNIPENEILPGFEYDYLASVSVRHPLNMRILHVDSTVNPSSPYPFARNLQTNGSVLVLLVALESATLSNGGITLYEITDPAVPQQVGQYNPSRASVTSFALDGSAMYVTTREQGLHIVDIADPSSPQRVGQFPPAPEGLRAEAVRGVTLIDDVAYVSAGRDGLKTLDLSDPYDPYLTSEIVDGSYWWSVLIDEEENTLYKGRAVYDISNPLNPTFLDSVEIANWRYFQVGGNVAYVIRQIDTIKYGSNYHVYTFESYDRGGQSGTSLLSADTIVASSAAYLTLESGRIFIKVEPDRSDQSKDEIYVYDISASTTPVLSARITTKALGGIGRFAVAGNRLFYWEAGAALRIVEFTDSNNWSRMGNLIIDEPYSITASADRLYLVTQAERDILLVDVTDPMNPMVSGSYAAIENVNKISVSKDLIAVAARQSLVLLRPALQTGVADEYNTALPKSFALKQNYPNPFNPSTIISYALPKSAEVELSVYNLLGQRVATLANEKQSAGRYSVEWNAAQFASGAYFYQLKFGDEIESRKMILLK